MFFRTLFGAILLLMGLGCSVMIFVSLDKGNWPAGFFMFPALTYLSLDKFYNLLSKK